MLEVQVPSRYNQWTKITLEKGKTEKKWCSSSEPLVQEQISLCECYWTKGSVSTELPSREFLWMNRIIRSKLTAGGREAPWGATKFQIPLSCSELMTLSGPGPWKCWAFPGTACMDWWGGRKKHWGGPSGGLTAVSFQDMGLSHCICAVRPDYFKHVLFF